MRVLITGANGFVGRNLQLRLRERKDVEVVCYTRDQQAGQLAGLLEGVDFVFHLAGINRPQDPKEFQTGNANLTRDLCQGVVGVARSAGRSIPILYTSSTQAALDNAYGRSKHEAEEALAAAGQDPLVPVHVFRLPNVFGKWCRPNYNSAVATFCHNIARGLPIQINDPQAPLTLVYIDDVVERFVQLMDGAAPMAGPDGFSTVQPQYATTVGELARLIRAFHDSRNSLVTERVGTGLVRALYATYVSYLPVDAFAYDVPQHADRRGVFVEMLKTPDCGQFSFFTAHTGVTRGGHYHHSKTEKFLVIKGQALFRFRHMQTGQTHELHTSGDKPQVVETVPGWTHDITNTGPEEMVVMLWANEIFDRARPDTYDCPPMTGMERPDMSMKKLKVMTVVGTRPEIIRLSRVLARLDEYCDHVLVHTGQNYDYELNQVFFDDLGVRKPDHFLDSAANSTGAAQTIGNLIIAVDRVLEQEQPEAMLVLGDTNSCLAVIPAKRRKIPIFHMEAGNRCFDQRVPEETNRRIVDHTADVNLTYSTIARDYLLREGLPPDLVVKTGSPMCEVLAHYRPRIDASEVLQRLGLQAGSYFVVSAHREENIESPQSFAKLVEVLNAVAGDHDLPVIVSTHPRTQKRIDATGARFHPQVRLLKPLGFHDYVRLQLSARAVLSDSGTINEESSILNFPALNLREAHERPEGMEEGVVMMVGLEVARVRQALAILADQPRGAKRGLRQVTDYSMPNVSDKVLRIIHSYTDYVNRVIWKKY